MMLLFPEAMTDKLFSYSPFSFAHQHLSKGRIEKYANMYLSLLVAEAKK